MLTLSEAAAKAIEDLAGEGGLRLVVHEGDEEIELSVVGAPEPGDEVVECSGARVFIDPAAVAELDDQILDVHAHGDHFHFTFEQQDQD